MFSFFQSCNPSIRTHRRTKDLKIEIFVEEDDEEHYTIKFNIEDQANEPLLVLTLTNPNGEIIQEWTLLCAKRYTESFDEVKEHVLRDMIPMINELDPYSISLIVDKQVITRTETQYAAFLNRFRSRRIAYESEYDNDEDINGVLDFIENARDLGWVFRYDRKLEFGFWLESYLYNAMVEKVEHELKDKECPVALEALRPGHSVKLTCNHYLSLEAYNKIKENAGHPKCPVCRQLSCPSEVSRL